MRNELLDHGGRPPHNPEILLFYKKIQDLNLDYMVEILISIVLQSSFLCFYINILQYLQML
mgnify:CR=1 FL=1